MAREKLQSWIARAVLVAHTIAVACLVSYAWRHPLGNWDIIPYAAIVRSGSGVTPAEASREAYQDVRAYVGDEKFRTLVDGGDQDGSYRAAVHGNPVALEDNLRFYSVKPLYIVLSRWAFGLTGNAASAAVLVSALAFGVLFAAFPFLFRRPLIAVAGSWVLAMSGTPPLWLIVSTATPDSLAMLLVTACALAGTRGRHPNFAAALGVAAILARPDAAFIIVPLLVGFAWQRRRQGEATPLLAGAGASLVIFLYLGAQAMPWSTLFWHTFVAREPFPSDIVHHVTLVEYWAVVQRTAHAIVEPRPVAFMLAGLAAVVVPRLRSPVATPGQWMAAVAVAAMLVHYLVFPIDEYGYERMFLASYMLVLAAALLASEGTREGTAIGVSP